MSFPSGNGPNDKPLPPLPLPPFKQGTVRRRRDTIYTQSNAGPIRPSPSHFGGDGHSSSTFYSFPRLPEEPGTPTPLPPLPPVNRQGRTPSFSERISAGIRSLIGRKPPIEERRPLLNTSQEKHEADKKQQKTSDGAYVFCQHVANETCQCTVTMPIAVGRNLCQTCSDGKCAAASQGSNAYEELKCRHLWDDKCQCQSFALWVTGDELCGPCWYGQCQGEKRAELQKEKTA